MLFKLATHKGARQKFDERGPIPELGAVHAVSILCDTRQKRLLTSDTRQVLTERTRHFARRRVTHRALHGLFVYLAGPDVSAYRTRFWSEIVF